jgi:hypothetical protein
MAKDIIIDLAFVVQKKHAELLDLLNEMGFQVIKVKASLGKHRLEISVSPDFCFCLCCGAEMESKTFKSSKSNYMCQYCNSGSCDAGEVGYEDGHGQLEGVLGTHSDEDEEDRNEQKDTDDNEEEEDEDEEK